LSSKFGVPLVVGGTYGAIIQHIEPEHIADLPVPRLGKEVEQRAHEFIVESANLFAKYQADVNSATKRLFASVALEDITAADWHLMGRDLGFSVPAPCVNSLRALNFTPRFQRLAKAVRAAPHKSLGDLVVPGTLQRGGRFKRIDAAPEHSYQLVGQRELFWVKPEGRWIAKSAVGKDVLVGPGTILVAAQGTLGESELYCRAEFVWGPATSLAYSEHLLRVIADEEKMLAGCLYAFMRSETAFRMLRSISTGTKLQDHHRVMLAALPVPLPPPKVQQEIHRLVVDAYEARHKAIALEKQATALVEDTIEKGATS
jgi:type I restriction enzyme S subunit